MKKLKLSLVALLPLLCGVSSVGVQINSNKSFISHSQNDNLSLKSNIGDIQKTNNANVTGYGPFFNPSQPITATRLSLFMKNDVYNTFLAMLGDSTQERFIQNFLGNATPQLIPEWASIKTKITNDFKAASLHRGKDPDYLFNLFDAWIKSTDGWNMFKKVFTGEDLRNNTYKMPPGYDEREAQLDFRRNGVIMQFNIVPINEDATTWKVSQFVKIFPYTKWCLSLKQYYLDTITQGKLKFKAPPLIGIHLPYTPYSREKVSGIKNSILQRLYGVFNFSPLQKEQKLVRIPETEDSKYLNDDKKLPTIINVAFYSQEDNPRLYMTKEVKLYTYG